ncbi:MAG: macrodomain Ter protein organizer (MatP/YcbG family) [Oleiphilaceae bacterium]|jgi:macrodomain Ter protein organizer (MatP/YcbG family)
MPKVANIFNDYYYIQESWIRRQINNLKGDSFVDLSLAKKEIEDAGLVAFVDLKSIEQFREKHLSEIGKKKLSVTLRTYKKRENRKLTTKRLDIDISLHAHLALKNLVIESGLTKIQIIEQLLLQERENQINDA